MMDPLERCQLCGGFRILPGCRGGDHLTYYEALRVKLRRTGDPWDLPRWVRGLAAEAEAGKRAWND